MSHAAFLMWLSGVMGSLLVHTLTEKKIRSTSF